MVPSGCVGGGKRMIFNGNDLLAFCGGGVSINKEIPPFTVGRTITAVGGAGGHILGNVANAPKVYTAKINLHGNSTAEAWAQKRRVAEWAMTTTELADLIPSHDPARKYRAVCQGISDPEFKWGACTVNVDFYIPEPYMLSVYPLTVGGTSADPVFINNGTAEPLMTVRFVPLVDVDYPTIMLNGEAVLTINGTVGAGVPVVVDFGQKTAKINGVYAQDKINYMLTDWHPVFSQENTVSVEASTVTVEVIERWL